MFFSSGIIGNDLPPKTVCLTFDDGPGPKTLEIAQFLHCRGIRAAFFVIGEFASNRMDILRGLAEMGHLIGNHTYGHPLLADRTGNFAAGQIVRSDEILARFTQPLRCFRPPYGWWSPTLAGELNWTAASHYVGPILWDINAEDWRFWAAGRPVTECVSAYIDSIRQAGRGVILLHDSSLEPAIRARNNTLEAVRSIVDWLQENGYSFVRLDAVPQVREAARVTSVVSLQTAAGHYLGPDTDTGEVLANARELGPWEPLGIVELGHDRIAFRSLSGSYLSLQKAEGGRDEGGRLLANAWKVGEEETFTRIQLSGFLIALRCHNGQYLSSQPGDDRLRAHARHADAAQAFQVTMPPANA